MIGLYKYKPLKLCSILQAVNSPQNKVAMRKCVTEKLFYISCRTPFLSEHFALNSLAIMTDSFLTGENMSIITQCLGERGKLPQYD